MRKVILILLFFTGSFNGFSQFIINPFTFAVVSYDADAQNYFTRVEAHGVTITTAQKGYINTLFVNLKSNSLYTIPYDMYFFGWANASANAEPLKAVAPDITWNGGITHSSGGIQGNGSTGYGDFNVGANTLTLNNTHIAVYSRSEQNSILVDIGVRGATATVRFDMFLRNGGNFLVEMNSNTAGTGNVSAAVPSSLGMSIGSRTSSTDLRAYKNGSQVGSTSVTTNNGTMPTGNIYVLANNNNSSAASFSTRQIIMASYGAGFTPTEAATYTTIWNTLLTSFGLNTF